MPEEVSARLTALIAARPGLTWRKLREQVGGEATADHLFTLIVQEHIYTDWTAAPLVEPGLVRLFRDRATATALTLATPATDYSELARATAIETEPGTAVEWEGSAYSIVHVGRTTVFLQGEQGRLAQLELPHWQALIGKGDIRPLPAAAEDAARITPGSALACITERGPRQLADGNRRALVVRPRLFSQGQILADLPGDVLEEIAPRAFAHGEVLAVEVPGGRADPRLRLRGAAGQLAPARQPRRPAGGDGARVDDRAHQGQLRDAGQPQPLHRPPRPGGSLQREGARRSKPATRSSRLTNARASAPPTRRKPSIGTWGLTRRGTGIGPSRGLTWTTRNSTSSCVAHAPTGSLAVPG